jgi:hypothetical protein
MNRLINICLLAVYLLHGLAFPVSQLGHMLLHVGQEVAFDGHAHGHTHQEQASPEGHRDHAHTPWLLQLLNQASVADAAEEVPEGSDISLLINLFPGVLTAHPGWETLDLTLVAFGHLPLIWHAWSKGVPVPPPWIHV